MAARSIFIGWKVNISSLKCHRQKLNTYFESAIKTALKNDLKVWFEKILLVLVSFKEIVSVSYEKGFFSLLGLHL